MAGRVPKSGGGSMSADGAGDVSRAAEAAALTARVKRLALKDDEVEEVLAGLSGQKEEKSMLDLTQGTFLDVLVSHVADRNEWSVQPLCCKTAIEEMCLKMNVFFGRKGEEARRQMDEGKLAGLPKGNPEPFSREKKVFQLASGCTKLQGTELNVYCAAPYTDGGFYRCRIIGRVSPKEVKLSYIDYGNEHVVPVEKIYELPVEFRTLPPLSVTVNPPIREAIDVPFLKELVGGSALILEIVEAVSSRKVKANLFMVEDGVQYDYVAVVSQAWLVEQNDQA